jgi:hypothetical protein
VDLSGTGSGPVENFYEHGNEPSGYIEGGEFLDQLSAYQLLKWSVLHGVRCMFIKCSFLCPYAK